MMRKSASQQKEHSDIDMRPECSVPEGIYNDFLDDNTIEFADASSLYPDKRSNILSIIRVLESNMPPRLFDILKKTLCGQSRKSIAREYNLSEERIRQICEKNSKLIPAIISDKIRCAETIEDENIDLRIKNAMLKAELSDLKSLLAKQHIVYDVQDEVRLDLNRKRILYTPIEELALSARAKNVLRDMGVKNFAEILLIESPLTLYNQHHCGRRTIQDIVSFLKSYNLQLGMSFNDVVRNIDVTHETNNSIGDELVPQSPKPISIEQSVGLSERPKDKWKNSTIETTFDLLQQGKSIQEVAKERGLSIVTIQGHVAELIQFGHVDISQYVDKTTYETVSYVFHSLGLESPLKEVKSLCPEKIDYQTLHMVKGDLLRKEHLIEE